jgi:phosphoglycolate phosphatase-like HAD superfamily hydrolase
MEEQESLLVTGNRATVDYKAFFFDFDGVLADSVEVKTWAFAKLFELHGPRVMSKVIAHHRRYGGMTRVDKFRHYYSEYLDRNLSDEEMADLCRRFSELVVDEVVAAPEIKGAEKFLKYWYSRLPCFVISATPEDEIRQIIHRRALGQYFREILGAPFSKDTNLGLILDKYSLESSKCLFFGDAESDYKAAQTHAVNFLAILPGPEAHLLRLSPQIQWLRDFTEVAKWLSLDNC